MKKEERTRRPKRPKFLVIKGYPCVGKTELAHAISQEFHVACFSKDDVRDYLYPYELQWKKSAQDQQEYVKQALETHLGQSESRVNINSVFADLRIPNPNTFYDTNPVCYDIVLHLVKKQLSYCVDSIFESPLGKKSLYDRCKQVSQDSNADLYVIQCDLDHAEWYRRLEARRIQATNSDPNQLLEHRPYDQQWIVNYYSPHQYSIPADPDVISGHVRYIQVDMSQGIEQLVGIIRRQVFQDQ